MIVINFIALINLGSLLKMISENLYDINNIIAEIRVFYNNFFHTLVCKKKVSVQKKKIPVATTKKDTP